MYKYKNVLLSVDKIMVTVCMCMHRTGCFPDQLCRIYRIMSMLVKLYNLYISTKEQSPVLKNIQRQSSSILSFHKISKVQTDLQVGLQHKRKQA